ncbi:hypothetical protein [Paenibacillus amylolyticus]|uniref:hypothetical protein n=2 Tax=Paenibacillus amylolyticus TaxID=1451 RepID=UPI003EC025B6
MRKKILDSVLIELRLTFRSVLVWFAFLSVLVILFRIIYLRIIDIDIGGALTSTAAIVQCGIFVFLTIGFSMIRRERVVSVDEVFHSLEGAVLIKWVAKIISIFIFSAITLCCILIGLYFIYWTQEVPFVFYKEALLYLVLYYFLPFCISGLIGLLLGSILYSRIVYMILIVIGILIGPLNSLVLENVMAMFNMDLSPLLNMLNLGQSDIHNPFEPVYGYPMEVARWLMKLLWIMVLVLFIQLHVSLKIHRRLNIRNCLALGFSAGVSVLIVLFVIQEDQVIVTTPSVSSYLREAEYYQQHVDTEVISTDKFQVKAYDVKISAYRKLEVEAKVKLLPTESVNQVAFTLYHNFKVKDVKEAQGKQLTYKQMGDSIEVSFANDIGIGEKIDLVFRYSGVSSPFYYANEQAILLPFNFPWLPVAGQYPAMTYNQSTGLQRLTVTPVGEIDYSIEYDGSRKMYSNIPEEGPNKWRGKSEYGVTLASGLLIKERVQEVELVYPVSFYKSASSLEIFVESYKQKLSTIQSDLGLAKSKIETIFMLPIPVESVNFPEAIWKQGKSWIISVDKNYANGEILEKYSGRASSIFGSIIRESSESKWSEMQDVISLSYGYWYSLRYEDVPESLFNFLLTDYKNRGLKQEENVVQMIKEWIDKNNSVNDAAIRGKFQEWIKKVQSGLLGWDELELFFKKDQVGGR